MGYYPHVLVSSRIVYPPRNRPKFLPIGLVELETDPHTRFPRDGMSKDINFRICPHPNAKNLYVSSVGSNHGFKFLPVIGKYVADMLEGKLPTDYTELWSWKFGWQLDDVSNPHPYPVRELTELTGWERRHQPAAARLPWAWSKL